MIVCWPHERKTLNKRNQVASGFMVSCQPSAAEKGLGMEGEGPHGRTGAKHPIDCATPSGQKQLQSLS